MIGIHRLENIDSSFSYFLERPFGNIIIYADEVHHVYSDLITSKGGLAHMFFLIAKKPLKLIKNTSLYMVVMELQLMRQKIKKILFP